MMTKQNGQELCAKNPCLSMGNHVRLPWRPLTAPPVVRITLYSRQDRRSHA
ncbi:hypothetical protein [Azospirillum argentinense]